MMATLSVTGAGPDAGGQRVRPGRGLVVGFRGVTLVVTPRKVLVDFAVPGHG